MNFILENLKECETILIGTDSNCSEKSSKRRILAMHNFCHKLDLSKVSTSQPTFHHHNGSSESNIDYFLISKKYASKITKEYSICTLNTPESLSSHDPVVAALLVPPGAQLSTDAGKYSHTFSNFNQQKVIWDTTNLDLYQQTAAKVLSEYESIFPLLEHIPLKCELYFNLFVKSAELCLEMPQ